MAANAVVTNFNSEVPQGNIYTHMKFERDRFNVAYFSSKCSRRQGLWAADAAAMLKKTIISPNTLFGDIINLCDI